MKSSVESVQSVTAPPAGAGVAGSDVPLPLLQAIIATAITIGPTNQYR
jgi:multisubunit Na+/H+ antiporter MnhC subunit